MERRGYRRMGLGGLLCATGIANKGGPIAVGCVAEGQAGGSPVPWEKLCCEARPAPPAFSTVPVVGDGKWIWTRPPGPGQDPRPGARSKTASGEGKLVGTHPLDRYARR